MIVVACLEAVAVIAIVFMFLRDRQRSDAAWTVERRELLERIQRPERIPVTEPVAFMVPDAEPDELEMIGTIAEPPPGDTQE